MRIAQATTIDSVIWVQRVPMCVGNVVYIRFVVYELTDDRLRPVPFEYPCDTLKDAIELFNQMVAEG